MIQLVDSPGLWHPILLLTQCLLSELTTEMRWNAFNSIISQLSALMWASLKEKVETEDLEKEGKKSMDLRSLFPHSIHVLISCNSLHSVNKYFLSSYHMLSTQIFIYKYKNYIRQSRKDIHCRLLPVGCTQLLLACKHSDMIDCSLLPSLNTNPSR